MTKREMFAEIIAMVEGNEVSVSRDEILEFCKHEVELLEKKSSSPRKPTAKQLENAKLKEEIADHLMSVAEPKCIKEIVEEMPSLAGFTNQRVTHLLTDLVKSGTLTKEYVRKTPYYSIAL